jgi:chromosome segregation ATPase
MICQHGRLLDACYECKPQDSGFVSVDEYHHIRKQRDELRNELAAAREELERLKEQYQLFAAKGYAYRDEVAARDLVISKMREAILQFRNDPKLERANAVRATKGYRAMEYFADREWKPSTESLDAYVKQAVEQEREACAALCEEATRFRRQQYAELFSDADIERCEIAAAIRARKP